MNLDNGLFDPTSKHKSIVHWPLVRSWFEIPNWILTFRYIYILVINWVMNKLRELELELEKERHFVWEGWIRILSSEYLWWHILICSFTVMNSIPIDVLRAIITSFRCDHCAVQYLSLPTDDSAVVVEWWTSIATTSHNRLFKTCQQPMQKVVSSHD